MVKVLVSVSFIILLALSRVSGASLADESVDQIIPPPTPRPEVPLSPQMYLPSVIKEKGVEVLWSHGEYAPSGDYYLYGDLLNRTGRRICNVRVRVDVPGIGLTSTLAAKHNLLPVDIAPFLLRLQSPPVGLGDNLGVIPLWSQCDDAGGVPVGTTGYVEK